MVEHEVKGVQVHDARLAAWMLTQTIQRVITFNHSDFARYPDIVAEAPKTVVETLSRLEAES